jgi:hypothetical protein
MRTTLVQQLDELMKIQDQLVMEEFRVAKSQGGPVHHDLYWLYRNTEPPPLSLDLTPRDLTIHLEVGAGSFGHFSQKGKDALLKASQSQEEEDLESEEEAFGTFSHSFQHG